MDTRTPSRRSRLSRLSLLAAGIMLATTLHAQDTTHALNLPAQPLDQALNALAGQTDSRILFATDIAEGLSAPAVTGEMTVQQALERLLKGSDLTVQQTSDGSFVIAAPVASGAVLDLGAITIQGQGMGETTENTGSYTPGLISVGSKSPTSLKETPQSVSVITRQVIEDRQITDINEAMKAVPGITVQSNTFRIQDFYSRGFPIQNIQLDGAAPMALGTTAGSFYSSNIYDLAEFDHVEVLRGSSALFGGTGDPGGIINLVRKRPLDTYQLKFSASAGSWDNYRSELDVTGPLGFDGRLRGRMVMAYQDRQYFVDNRATDKPLVYGVLEADVSDDTMLTAGLRFNKVHETGTASQLPRYSNGADLGLPRHTGLSTTWAYADGFSREYFAKLDHRLNDDWKLNLSYTNIYDTISTLR